MLDPKRRYCSSKVSAIHERAPLSITTLCKQRLDSISGVVLFQSPAQIRLPVRIDERECQNSARCEARAQLSDEFLHLFTRCVRKNRISENEIKLNAEIRHRQIDARRQD